jgi:threonine 3-dehydrogenase
MKALVKKTAEPGLWLADVQKPVPGPNDVLIKIHKSAICGTDLHIYTWDAWAQQTIHPPMTIGHEYVGTIAELGQNVKGLQTGQLVSGEGHLVCGRCRNCLAGRRHMCRRTEGVGVDRDGAFAEFLCIPASNVWICDPSIPEDVLACFDPFGNAVHTALSFELIGEDVLITGAGPIGLFATAVARFAGARYVVTSDVNTYRLKLASKMGASRVVDARQESIAEVVTSLGMKEGFDIGFEMSGNGRAFEDMLANMNHGGQIGLLGILDPNTAIDWNKVIFKSLQIKGIYGRELFETWYKMTSMLQTGLDITPAITHRFHYTEFEQGFELMRAGECGKVVLNWTDD